MKTLAKFLYALILFFGFIISLQAQTPQGIPYQAIARNGNGEIIPNQNISLRFSIHEATANGTILYQETHNVTTNSLGMFTLNMGQGTPITGTFATINWGSGAKFTQMEMDITGGNSFVDIGTQQMMSVPYALYSANNWSTRGNAGTNKAVNFIGTTDNNFLTFKINNTKAGEIGFDNTSLGLNSMFSNTTGFVNTGIGSNALYSNTSGYYNTAIGSGSLSHSQTGFLNTAIGTTTMDHDNVGFKNTAVGASAMHSGGLNTSIGSFNTAIGANSYTENALNNSTVVGANAMVTQSNSLVLGSIAGVNGATNSTKVGIGNTAPLMKLHVTSTDSAVALLENSQALAKDVRTAQYFKAGDWYTGAIKTTGTGSQMSSLGFYTYAMTNANSLIERMTITDGGLVGIGTTSPEYPLDVNGNILIRAKDYDAGIWLNKRDNSGISAFIGNWSDNDIIIHGNSGNSHRFVFNHLSGNFGIDNLNPIVPLSFPPSIGKKISLYPGTNGDVGFGVYGNELRIHSDYSGADITFGYDTYNSPFKENVRFTGHGEVGIGTTAPDLSAKLDVTSTTQGFLPPRMTIAQRDAIVSPATGLTIYNSSINAFQVYNGTAWYSTVHYIGEHYGGGIVFYVYDNGQHGLIAAAVDQSTGIQWYNGTFMTCNASRTGINGGLTNTNCILLTQGDGSYAATTAMLYTGGGFSDWYLPSKDELNFLYHQKSVVGGFGVNSWYWSSTDYNINYACIQNFNNGNQGGSLKSDILYVRAVRAF